ILNGAALGLLLWTEDDLDAQAAFVLSWGLLNGFWLLLLRRPLMSATISLAMVVVLIVLSQFKHHVLMMTATFVDLMVVDFATFSFLLTIIPGLAWQVGLAVLLTGLILFLIWQIETWRVRRAVAAVGFAASLAGLAALSLALPMDREDEFI